MDNRTRITGVVILVLFAVLDSLAQQGLLSEELTALVHEVVVFALPAVGLGALVDVVHVEHRRRNPAVPALKDDVQAQPEVTRGES